MLGRELKRDGSESVPSVELLRNPQKDKLLGAGYVYSEPVPPEPILTVPPEPPVIELLVVMVTVTSDFVA